MTTPFSAIDLDERSALAFPFFKREPSFPSPSTLNPAAQLEDLFKRSKEFLGEETDVASRSRAAQIQAQQGQGATSGGGLGGAPGVVASPGGFDGGPGDAFGGGAFGGGGAPPTPPGGTGGPNLFGLLRAGVETADLGRKLLGMGDQGASFFGPQFAPFKIPEDVLTGKGGGSATSVSPKDLAPFQVPSDVLSGASGGSTPPVPIDQFGAGVEPSAPSGPNIAGGATVATAAAAAASAALRASGDPNAERVATMLDTMATTASIPLTLGLSLPIRRIVGALTGANEPEHFFSDFPGSLGSTLATEMREAQRLIDNLTRAQTQGDVGQAVNLFDVDIGSRVGGYPNLGPNRIADLPGATGTRHEGGVTADFGPVTSDINALMAALYQMLPAGAPTGATTMPLGDLISAGQGPVTDEFGATSPGIQVPPDAQITPAGPIAAFPGGASGSPGTDQFGNQYMWQPLYGGWIPSPPPGPVFDSASF